MTSSAETPPGPDDPSQGQVDPLRGAGEAASVVKGTDADVGAMARTLARAFEDDPAFTWVLRGDERRGRMLEGGFELFLRRIWLEQDETFTTAGKAGVAVWELPGRWQLGIGRQLALLPGVVGVFKRRALPLLRALYALEASHPREPHYYLPFIGVDPRWQGRGIGAALLAPILARCDAEAMPAFLEASSPRNRAMYERHSFAVMDEFTLGPTAPPQWRMWRQPQPAAASDGAGQGGEAGAPLGA